MAIDIYWIGLLVLLPCVALVAGRDFLRRPFVKGATTSEKDQIFQRDEDANKIRRTFLQGPYLYSLLRDEKKLPEQTVALIYTSAYASAAVSAPLTGWLADKWGRRTVCLAFCAIHALASASVLFDHVAVLTIGRVLGDIGITLLWSAFESWMVTEYNARGIAQSSVPLSAMFDVMTTWNCITAILAGILAGILAHCLVLALGSEMDPFLLSIILDIAAAGLMLWTWNENYGIQATDISTEDDVPEDSETTPRSWQKKWRKGLVKSLQDGRVWILSFVSCCFEGTIFLLMFYWPGALQEAHDREQPSDEDRTVPYGVIFAAFTAIMVLGALFFNWFMRKGEPVTPRRRFLTPTRLLAAALFFSTVSFVIAACARRELHICAFSLLEACNGIYVPSMAFQRGKIVSDSSRASVYGLMNIPLFIFVIVALATTNGDDRDQHRHIVFILYAVLLLVASVATLVGLGGADRNAGFEELPTKDVEVEELDAEKALKIPTV